MGHHRRGGAAQPDPLATLDPVSGLIQHQTAFDDPQDLTAWQTVSAPRQP